jgi:hypothetical protein
VNADEVDTAAVDADDTLLDVLGGRATEPPADAVSDDLSGLLHAWLVEVDSRSAGQLVTTRQGLRTVRRARWARRLARLIPARVRSTR